MVDDVARDGKRGLAKHITEHIVELQVRDRQAILGAVLLSGLHVGQFAEIADEIAQVPDSRRRNEARPNHIAHEEVADPFRILPVGLVALLRFGVLGMGKRDRVVLFEDIEHGNPIFSC